MDSIGVAFLSQPFKYSNHSFITFFSISEGAPTADRNVWQAFWRHFWYTTK